MSKFTDQQYLKTDQYQDEFDLIYEELEPTYIP